MVSLFTTAGMGTSVPLILFAMSFAKASELPLAEK